MSDKIEPEVTWSKNERRLLHLFAALGFVNILAYILTQSTYVMQNIYVVYGMATVIDAIGFFGGFMFWYDETGRHHHMPARLKNFLIASGLWLLSIPVVIISFYYPVISVSLGMVLDYMWGISLVASGIYNTAYIMTVLGCWLTKGVE